MRIVYINMNENDYNHDIWKPPPKPKKLKMKDVFVIPKNILSKDIQMVSDKDLTKLTLPQLQKMAKQMGVKNYSSYRKAGLIDRLSKDNSMQFTVPKKGGARVGQKRGARLAFDKKKPKKK
jgi:hypothetical protein